MPVKLRTDSRDLHYQKHFGSVSVFPLESNYGDKIVWDIELPNETDCTAESGGKVCTSQTKTVYDHEALWSNTPHDAYGADPRDSMQSIVSFGMIPVDKTKPVDKIWKSYLRTDTGDQTPFDNVRSAMLVANSSSTCATNWYEEWSATPPNGIMPMGVNKVSAHDWVVVDWKQINGITMFLIDAHLGYPLYMPQEVFNEAMKPYGVGAWMPTTQLITLRVQLDILTKIKDALTNLWLLVQERWILKKKLQ